MARGAPYRRAGGTWQDTANPTHRYEFLPDGEVAAWTGSRSWWNRLGWSAAWRRSGPQITDRNWDFTGRLEGNAIRGKVLLRGPTGAADNEIDAVWQRE